MTDDEILEIANKQTGESKTFEEWALGFARAITPAQPEPEPVAYINVEERMLEWVKPTRWKTPTTVKMDKVPLYTEPPKKEWVRLTDEDIKDIEGWVEFKEAGSIDPVPLGKLVLYISHKLREKNTF